MPEQRPDWNAGAQGLKIANRGNPADESWRELPVGGPEDRTERLHTLSKGTGTRHTGGVECGCGQWLPGRSGGDRPDVGAHHHAIRTGREEKWFVGGSVNDRSPCPAPKPGFEEAPRV